MIEVSYYYITQVRYCYTSVMYYSFSTPTPFIQREKYIIKHIVTKTEKNYCLQLFNNIRHIQLLL